MKPASLSLPLLCCILHAAAEPVTLGPPVEFAPPSADGTAPPIRYLGQPAKDGRIDLTATNGFFDRCFRAAGQGPVIPGDAGLINVSFDHLRKGSGSTGTARWHLWCPQPGEVVARFHLTVPEAEAGHSWTIRFGSQERTIQGSNLSESLAFEVTKPGKHTFTIDCSAEPPPANTLIHFITLEGSAIPEAKLLRARWRPAAEHQGFSAPPACEAPDTWVFESEAVTPVSSYSPMTTPFGYFGTVFDDEGRVPAGGSFNFSMWLARQGDDPAPPIAKMPHILATGMPTADFSHFSHEGTGVKLRNAVAYPTGAARTIQALRVTFDNGLWTYHGYYYDEPAGRWKLFAAGRNPHPANRRAPDPLNGLLRQTGSFCEIPGPPDRERSGDVVRIIRRRGWFLDQDRRPHRAIMSEPTSGRTPSRDAVFNNQRSHYMDDYPADGWIAMQTGGMERHPQISSPRPSGPSPTPPTPLPEYLQPEKLRQLDELPVTFGTATVTAPTSTSATIDYPLLETGPNSSAVLHYGTVDALTYPATRISSGSVALRDMFRPERTWQHSTPATPVAAGPNRFELTGLKPDTTYHFRIFVRHDEGKSWDFQSGTFRTLP